ncbi:MAG: hypothetical protein ABSH46_10895 [Bryobacteraceae bacterium]|jgi:hypothetical protein
MPSDRQIKANQENARLSTGPRTPEGKARSSLNAVRHGLLARDAVLPEEDRAAHLDLLAALEEEYQPDGPTQTFLVQQLASAQWRLQRFVRIETGFFAARMERVRSNEYEDQLQHEADDATTPEEKYEENTRLLGVLFLQHCNGDSITKLARYGSMLNREYYRALKALEPSRCPTPPPRPIAEQRAPVKTNPIFPVPDPAPLAIKDHIEDHGPVAHESRCGPSLADPVFPLQARPRAA